MVPSAPITYPKNKSKQKTGGRALHGLWLSTSKSNLRQVGAHAGTSRGCVFPTARLAEKGGGGGGVLIIMYGRSRMTLYPGIPIHKAGTEHVGFSPTRHTLLEQSAKRREVFGDTYEG